MGKCYRISCISSKEGTTTTRIVTLSRWKYVVSAFPFREMGSAGAGRGNTAKEGEVRLRERAVDVDHVVFCSAAQATVECLALPANH